MPYTLTVGLLVPVALTELDYTYYADGSVHTVTDSSNVAGLSGQSGTTTYAYDAMDNLTQLQQSGTGVTSKQVNYTYYADSQTHTVSRSVGGVAVAASTYTYDGMGRISTLQHTYGASGVINYSWQYDAASNVTEEFSPDGTDNYGLDASNQLTSASLTGEGYTYDQNGNRTDSGYVTGANNEMLSDGIYTYTYDKNGNRTAKFIDANHDGVLDAGDTSVTLYTYDWRNRLTEEEIEPTYGNPSEIVYFTYDYENRLIARYDYFVGGSTIAYTVYDGQNAYLQVTDPNYSQRRRQQHHGHDFSALSLRPRRGSNHRHGDVFGRHERGLRRPGQQRRDDVRRGEHQRRGHARQVRQLRRADRRHGPDQRFPLRLQRDALRPGERRLPDRDGPIRSFHGPAIGARPDWLRFRHDELDGLVREQSSRSHRRQRRMLERRSRHRRQQRPIPHHRQQP